jgi:hypothetical protein
MRLDGFFMPISIVRVREQDICAESLVAPAAERHPAGRRIRGRDNLRAYPGVSGMGRPATGT